MRFAVLTTALAVASTALGQTPVITGLYKDDLFPSVPPPTFMSWEISTADGLDKVGVSIPNIVSNAIGLKQQWIIEENMAAQFGIDWDAWEAAANNPAFTLSILKFGSTTKTAPLSRNFAPGDFALDRFVLFVDHWVWPPDSLGFVLTPEVFAGASSFPIVPEPATWILLSLGLLLSSFRRIRNYSEPNGFHL